MLDTVVQGALDWDMMEGESIRIKECSNCLGNGTSKAVQITRKPDGFFWYCFRCDQGGFFPDKKHASPEIMQKRLKGLRDGTMDNTTKDTRPIKVCLPEDATTELPAQAQVMLYDWHLTDDDLVTYNILWSPSHGRIIIPIYKYIYSKGHPNIWARKLIGWTGRKLKSDTNKDKPKWSTTRQRDIKHIRYTALPDQPAGVLHRKQIIIVEDVFSAIRMAQVGYIGIALLTTYLPDELLRRCRGWGVILWLDFDAVAKASKYQHRFGCFGIPCVVNYSVKDPKEQTGEFIKENIQRRLDQLWQNSK